MRRVELSRLRRRLDVLSVACGSPQQGSSDVMIVDEEKLRDMTPYQQEEYKVAVEMRNFRSLLQTEFETKKNVSHEEQMRDPELLRMRHTLRKSENKFRLMQKTLIAAAKTDDEKTRCREVLHHLANTRKRYTDSRAYDEPGAAERAAAHDLVSHDSKPTNLLSNIEDVKNYGTSLRDDDEFQLFFSQVAVKDQQMDQALDRITQNVIGLHQNAKAIHEELKIQDKMIDDATRKVDNTTSELENLNKKVKKVIRQVDNDKLCMYVVCFLILLALVGFILMETGTFKHK